MKRTNRPALAALLALFLFSLPIFGNGSTQDAHPEHHASAGHAQSVNPLIEEMITLDAVFRDVVSGVAVSDGKRVHEALEKMHGSMERTHEGVHQGTVTLRKNADRLPQFIEKDRQFHHGLEELAAAAHRNDGPAMLKLTKELLDGCVSCHREYR